jgi:RNA polymerase sigma-70 factor, ECF subfamily
MAAAKDHAGPRASPEVSDGSSAAAGVETLDPQSRRWLARLTHAGADRDRALEELHALLLGAARFALARRASLLPQLGREGLDELAVEAADDALIAVLARLGDYRGESRFTTWAWKFAFLEACVAIRKRRWLGREIPSEDIGWQVLAREAAADRKIEQAELLTALGAAVGEVLTPHQRRVFVALALNEVPVDVLAERLGTTRGALYKTLHDARERLRRHLVAAGLGPDRWRLSPATRRSPKLRSRRRRARSEPEVGRRETGPQ